MVKYSLDLKLEMVKYCLDGKNSTEGTAKKYGMPSSTPLKEWIKKYQEHGIAGLIKQKNHRIVVILNKM